MPTTFYLSNGSVQGEPKPNVFVNPAAWTLQTATSYSGAGEEGRLEAVNQGVTSHRDMASPATIGYYRMTRFASKPLAAQTILAQTIQAIMTGFEDLGTANAEWAVQIFVWKNDDSGVRGPVLYLPTQFTEMNTDSETETSASGTSTQIVALEGDKLIVEVYYYKTAAKLEALSRHHYGPPDVSGYTSRIVFTNNVELAVTPKSFSDSGQGTDSFSKLITLLNQSFSDVGQGADAFAVTLRALSFSDVGQGLDVFSKLTTFQTKSFADSGLGSDVFINPYRAMGFVDSGLGSDVFTNPFRVLGFLDSGAGADLFSKEVLIPFIPKSFDDSGLGSDQFINSFRAMGFSDSGLGTDVFSILKAMGFSDVGNGADSFSIPLKALQFSDVGQGLDVFSKAVTLLTKTFSDSGLGVDAFILTQLKGFADVALGSDVFTNPFRALGFSDVGSGLDSFNKTISVLVTKAFADSGLGTDIFAILLKSLVFSDVGTSVDAFTKSLFGVVYNSYGLPFTYDRVYWVSHLKYKSIGQYIEKLAYTPLFYLEVSMRAIIGTVYARLYDETLGQFVENSSIQTTQVTIQTLRSQPIVLNDGHVYRAQFGKAAGDQGGFLGAKIIARKLQP